MKVKINLAFYVVPAALLLIIGGFLIIEPPTRPVVEDAEETSGPSIVQIDSVVLGGKEIKVDLAITNEERSRGLSERTHLEEDTGMLFVFDAPGRYSFWMKDMNFPIDIMWIDEELYSVVYIKKDAQSDSYPESFTPPKEATFVLEVPAGFADRYNIQEGTRIGFIYK